MDCQVTERQLQEALHGKRSATAGREALAGVA
jgi:hypothetical protein